MKGRINYLVHFLILFLALFFQSSPLAQRISVAGVWPNAVFVIIFVYSLYLKQNEVLTYAVIFGSVIDLLFGNVYGVNTLLLMLITFLTYILNKFVYSESFLSVFVYAFVASALYEGMYLIINFKLCLTGDFMSQMLMRYAVKCVYNAVFALPVFYVAGSLRKKRQEVHY